MLQRLPVARYIQKILKKSNKSNKFKISAPTWHNKFQLPD